MKKFLALVICLSMLCSMSAGFAAADVEYSAETLVDYTNGALPLAISFGTAPATTLSVVDMFAIDSNAAADEEAIRFAHTDGNGTAVAGRGTEAWNLTNDTSLVKYVGFDVYVPEADFYGVLRGAYSRYATNSLTTGNWGFINEIEFSSANRPEGWNTIVNLKNNSGTTDASVKLINKQWHRIEMFINSLETEWYINGEYIGKSVGVEGTGSAGYTTAFLGFASLPGYNSADVIYNGENAGLYFDNLKVKSYESADEEFMGMAEVKSTADVVNGVIKVYFNEPAKKEQSVDGVKLYNTETGAEVPLQSVSYSGDVMTLILAEGGEFSRLMEFMIDMPDGFKSIRGKEIYSDIYFISNRYNHVIDFENYKADVETVSAGVIKSLTSSQGKVYRKENIQIADPEWMSAGLVGVKDLSGTYSERGNVMAIRNVPDNPRGLGEIRLGITLLSHLPNLAENSAVIEFDMMIPDRSRLNYLYFEPYALNNDFSAGSGTEVNHGGALTTNVHSTANTQYAQIFAPDNINTKFNVRPDGKLVGKYQDADTNGHFAHSAAYSNGQWCNIKVAINKTGDAAYTSKFYLDDVLVCAADDMSSDDVTDQIRGIRFSLAPAAAVTSVTDLAYIDDLKVRILPDQPKVLKMRIYNPDGEEFGMLSTGVSSMASTADIYLNGVVDATNATVTLTNGDDTITSVATYNSTENKLEVKFDRKMKPGAEYTINVTGLKTSDGTAVADYSAKFTTAEGEFEVTLILTDASGEEIEDLTNLSTDDEVYISSQVTNETSAEKNLMFIVGAYNADLLTAADIKTVTVGAGESLTLGKDSEEPVMVKVRDVLSLELVGYIWENITYNPIACVRK